MTSFLSTSIDAGVAVVVLDRSEARNAISSGLRAELVATLESLQGDDSVGAIVLTGRDPAFSAGVDIKEMEADPELARSIGPRLAPVIASAKPLIGAINGPAYTGGLELALACHWLIASDRASFADTHARLGLTPGWGLTVLLAEAVGIRRARQISATSLPIDASTALAWGLVNEVVPHEGLLDRALEMARAAVANPRRGVETVLRIYADQEAIRTEADWRVESANFIDPVTG